MKSLLGVLCSFFRVTSIVLFLSCGRSQTQGAADKMPPGDWTGRCKTPTGEQPKRKASAIPKKWVHDQAGILSATFVSELSRTLAAFHAETCHQLGVITVASLGGRPIADYSLSYASAAGFGYPGFNNGLTLFVAPNDQTARIEVGCGLEDVVSSQQAADVIRDITPAFRAGGFESGIRAGMNALIPLVKRKAIPDQFRPRECRQPNGP